MIASALLWKETSKELGLVLGSLHKRIRLTKRYSIIKGGTVALRLYSRIKMVH